jgi:hypothetical protein
MTDPGTIRNFNKFCWLPMTDPKTGKSFWLCSVVVYQQWNGTAWVTTRVIALKVHPPLS